MANFDLYAPILKKVEGGFVNDPIDKGGATNRGVTLRTYQSVYGDDKTIEDLKGMSDEEWEFIMKGSYWDKCKGDEIDSQSVAEIIVDWYINSGGVGIKRVQKLLGLLADGIIGDKTLRSINEKDPFIIFDKIKQDRKEYYEELVSKNPEYKKFESGWLNRLNYFNYQKK